MKAPVVAASPVDDAPAARRRRSFWPDQRESGPVELVSRVVVGLMLTVGGIVGLVRFEHAALASAAWTAAGLFLVVQTGMELATPRPGRTALVVYRTTAVFPWVVGVVLMMLSFVIE